MAGSASGTRSMMALSTWTSKPLVPVFVLFNQQHIGHGIAMENLQSPTGQCFYRKLVECRQ
jgi:hypothetical protein